MASIVRQTLDYAVDRELLSSNPFREFKVNTKLFAKTKKPESEDQIFSIHEISVLCEQAWDEFKKEVHNPHVLSPLCVPFAFQTGLRVGELVSIKFSDVEGDNIHIQRMLRENEKEPVNHTKTDSGDRFIYLTKEAKHILDVARQYQMAHCGHCEYVFTLGDLPFQTYVVHKLFKKYCKKAHIPVRNCHNSRKTYASLLQTAGVNPDEVRRLLGHSSVQTTYQHYYYDTMSKTERNALIEGALL